MGSTLADLGARHIGERVAARVAMGLFGDLFVGDLYPHTRLQQFCGVAVVSPHSCAGDTMANAMTLMDGAIAATLREALHTDCFDSRVKAAFYFSRKSSEFEQGSDPKRPWPPFSVEPLDISSGVADAENIERFKQALDYDKSKGLKSIWFSRAFVKPALVGLSIWMDRMSSPENTTPLSATIRRTPKGQSAYGYELTALEYNASSGVAGAAEDAERRASAALVAGAWWGLNSSTAQRLGFVALVAEAQRNLSTLVADPTATAPSAGRFEIGDSPYVILKEN